MAFGELDLLGLRSDLGLLLGDIELALLLGRLVTTVFDGDVVVLAVYARVDVLALDGSRSRMLELNRAFLFSGADVSEPRLTIVIQISAITITAPIKTNSIAA